ncbi:hypothetical protein CCACVL1_02599 [Corchorus capsularis]|uniref:Uncharacterized protein n=1 Tax=Corchorus capsularis TaxID=210143 RepID=A0A1R3K7K3_COCAP|nr:hypothetical protein CCACVL1_02599 [Corchorus capsularis]
MVVATEKTDRNRQKSDDSIQLNNPLESSTTIVSPLLDILQLILSRAAWMVLSNQANR